MSYYGAFFIYVYHIWFFYFKMGGDITESPNGKVDHLMGKVSICHWNLNSISVHIYEKNLN